MRFLHKFTLLLGIMVIVSSFIQFLVFDRYFLAATDSLLLTTNEKAANNLGEQLFVYFKKIENSLQMIASGSRMRESQELLDEINQIIPEVDAIGVFDQQGNVLISSGTSTAVSGMNFSQREYFQQALQGKTYISDIYTSSSGNQVISISTPIIEDGIISGVVVGVIRLQGDILVLMFDNKSFGRGGFIAISDRQDNIVYHPNKERIGQKSKIADQFQGVTGSAILQDSAGVDRYIGYSRVPELDWIVSVNTPTGEITQSRNMMIYEILVLSFVAILVIVMIGSYTVRRYTKPLDRLIVAFSSVNKGKYKQIDSYDYATEFDEMIQVYNNMVLKLETVHKDLAGAADRDGLTGAYNRRAFDSLMDILRREVEAQRLRKMGILLLDLDNFKYLNDTQGHLTGDDILKEWAAIMQSIVGDRAVFRFGGDEFTVVLRDVSEEQLFSFAEEIRLRSEKSLHGCTVSAGLATWPGNTDSINELLDLADRALYRSKESKNKVTCFR